MKSVKASGVWWRDDDDRRSFSGFPMQRSGSNALELGFPDGGYLFTKWGNEIPFNLRLFPQNCVTPRMFDSDTWSWVVAIPHFIYKVRLSFVFFNENCAIGIFLFFLPSLVFFWRGEKLNTFCEGETGTLLLIPETYCKTAWRLLKLQRFFNCTFNVSFGESQIACELRGSYFCDKAKLASFTK